MKKRLAIFDLDGTLYDTRAVNYMSYRLALRGLGAELDREFFYQRCNGQYYKHFLPAVVPGITPEDMETVHERKKALYSDCLTEAAANDHLIGIIQGIRGTFHTALVTTASKRNAFEILDHFGHAGLFDLILTQENVTRKKPDPECFWTAMERLGASPEETVIFEDSEAGVQAALATGAGVCRVLDYI